MDQVCTQKDISTRTRYNHLLPTHVAKYPNSPTATKPPSLQHRCLLQPSSVVVTGDCQYLVGCSWLSLHPCTRGATTAAWPLSFSVLPTSHMDLLTKSHFSISNESLDFPRICSQNYKKYNIFCTLLITTAAFLPCCHLQISKPQHSWCHYAAKHKVHR